MVDLLTNRYRIMASSFQKTKEVYLEEIKSTLVELTHIPTGARVIHIANDDPENLFCLSFQTIPSKSDGVAHILEHTVLCGSKKFPIKDPFFSMTRRSLNTYMNALTGQDFTCYPASSQIEKDFYNLLEVYLDAAFHPELKKLSFYQEGHRLEFKEPQNPESELTYQGVVYNEMKGALSSPDARLWEALSKHLTPDLTYALNSGGDPKVIPELTYEELKSFHESYYHPSRCIFFFYGNLPLQKHLDFIEKNVLQEAKKKDYLPSLPKQKRFSSPKTVFENYPISPGESEENATWIVFSWLTASVQEQEDILALTLLDSLLMETDASPLKKALLKSGLCRSADASIDTEMSEAPFSIVLRGSEKTSLEPLREIIFKTLRECHFSQDEIEAALHQLEFSRSEIGADGVPFGLSLFFRSGLSKQHGIEPENALLIHSLFKKLRQDLKNPDYLKNLIKKYLLENPHLIELVFAPDRNLLQMEAEEEKKRLEKIKPTVDPQKILELTEELKQYQDASEATSLECLPKLKLDDVPKEAKDFPLQKEGSTYQFDCFTNHILYADIVYDLPPLNEKELAPLSLYSRFMTELGTGGKTYEEILTYQLAYIGGIDTSLAIHMKSSQKFEPTFALRGKVLEKNREKLFSLFEDLAAGVDLKDFDRLKELLLQHTTSLQNKLNRKALSYAIQEALAPFSIPSHFSHKFNGLPYFQKVLTYSKEPKLLQKDLIELQEKLLGHGRPELILTGSKEMLERKSFDLSKLPSSEKKGWQEPLIKESLKNEVRFISAPIAFTAKGIQTVTYESKEAPYLLLAAEILENKYLHPLIREKGGAYGGGASYTPSTGGFYFYAYRDPNLSKTLQAFNIATESVSKGGFDVKDLEEAQFGALQSIDAPVSPGSRAMTSYLWERSGRSFEKRQAFRNAILNAKPKDIEEAMQKHLLNQKGKTVSLLGEDLYKKEKPSLHEEFEILPI